MWKIRTTGGCSRWQNRCLSNGKQWTWHITSTRGQTSTYGDTLRMWTSEMNSGNRLILGCNTVVITILDLISTKLIRCHLVNRTMATTPSPLNNSREILWSKTLGNSIDLASFKWPSLKLKTRVFYGLDSPPSPGITCPLGNINMAAVGPPTCA